MSSELLLLIPLQWARIVQYSLLVGVTGVVWGLGLTLCGALRTVLLWEHSEMALLSAMGSLFALGSAKVGRLGVAIG